MAGLIGGVLFANLFGKNYLNQTGILSDYFLSKMCIRDRSKVSGWKPAIKR